MLTGKRAESLSWSDLEKDLVGFEQLGQPVSEANGLARMSCPIRGISGLSVGDPCAGDIRNEWDLGWLTFDFLNQFSKRHENGVHHRRMKRVRSLKNDAIHVASGELELKGFDCVP